MRALESVWLVPWSSSAVDLRDELKPFLDPNDGLLVIRVRRRAAWRHLDLRPRQMRAILQYSRGD